MRRWWLNDQGEKPLFKKRKAHAHLNAQRRFRSMEATQEKDGFKRNRARLLKAFCVAALCHLFILAGLSQIPKGPHTNSQAALTEPVSVVFLKQKKGKLKARPLDKAEDKKVDKEQKDEMPRGQIVALPPDPSAERPERADYLSESHHKVKHETRSRHAMNDPDTAAAHKLQMGVKGERPQVGEDHELQMGNAKVNARKKGAQASANEQVRKQAPEWMLALAQRQAQQELKLSLDLKGMARNKQRQEAQQGNAAQDMMAVGAQGATGGTQSQNSGEQGRNGQAAQDSVANLIPSFIDLKRWTGAPKNDYLPEVETEDATRLNSWQFQHAPFFNRIANGVRRTWNPGLAIRRYDPRFEVYGSQARHTVLSVTIDREGHLSGVDIYGPSGAIFLDDEAVRAFQKAAPFPNPPKGLFGREKTFTFNFGFNVDYKKRWQLDIDWQPYQ